MKKPFTNKKEVRQYLINGEVIQLELSENVFPPSDWAIKLANHIIINKNDKVIDIGTGSGILAIIAAKLGGNMYATDNCKDAIECARINASVNNVDIIFSCGNFFAEFDLLFDKVIVNLPQEIVYSEYSKENNKLLNAIEGGINGNQIILDFLSKVNTHIHAKSEIYIIVDSLSDFKTTLNEMTNMFNVKLLNIYTVENKEYVHQYLDYYLELNRKGLVYIFNINETWNLLLYVLCLTPK